ncbi:MAG: helix-turn-helix transcriptional regulator [Prevotella sp.]|nr:helix-turn-helix transcriptional regulator [Prevotella sp.]
MVIGQLIRQELQKQERTVTWFARKLNCNRQNVYDIFRRTNIDTDLLMRISIVLHVDFFKIYSQQLESTTSVQ